MLVWLWLAAALRDRAVVRIEAGEAVPQAAATWMGDFAWPAGARLQDAVLLGTHDAVTGCLSPEAARVTEVVALNAPKPNRPGGVARKFYALKALRRDVALLDKATARQPALLRRFERAVVSGTGLVVAEKAVHAEALHVAGTIARTQHLCIQDQLEQGVRLLDIRVALDARGFFGHHGGIVTDVRVLEDVVAPALAFAADSRETVILWFSHFLVTADPRQPPNSTAFMEALAAFDAHGTILRAPPGTALAELELASVQGRVLAVVETVEGQAQHASAFGFFDDRQMEDTFHFKNKNKAETVVQLVGPGGYLDTWLGTPPSRLYRAVQGLLQQGAHGWDEWAAVAMVQGTPPSPANREDAAGGVDAVLAYLAAARCEGPAPAQPTLVAGDEWLLSWVNYHLHHLAMNWAAWRGHAVAIARHAGRHACLAGLHALEINAWRATPDRLEALRQINEAKLQQLGKRPI